jgi:hypothetical protein
MSRVKTTKNKLKSKLEVIKKINDDPKKTTDDLYDLYLKDLPSTDQLFGKKFGDLLEKRKRKKENNQDIFSELIDVAESFFGINKTIGDTNKIFSKNSYFWEYKKILNNLDCKYKFFDCPLHTSSLGPFYKVFQIEK